MNEWKNVISERAVAPVANIMRPERLVGTMVAYNPIHFETLLFRAYVQSIANDYAELLVSIPSALHNLDTTEGRIYSLSPFHSNLPSFPIPPSIELTPSSAIINSVDTNSPLSIISNDQNCRPAPTRVRLCINQIPKPLPIMTNDQICRPASARVCLHTIPSPERIPYHIPRPPRSDFSSPSYPFLVSQPRFSVPLPRLSNQCRCSQCMS
jgi:hypothetical protein